MNLINQLSNRYNYTRFNNGQIINPILYNLIGTLRQLFTLRAIFLSFNLNIINRNRKINIKDMKNYGQVSERLSQFYSKAKNQKRVSYATNAYETDNKNAPIFMLSQIQINHYNLIELLAFELNKQITLRFSRFSEHQKAILLLKTIKIMDELQKLCCSIKIDYIYEIFLKIMTCLGTLTFTGFSTTFKQEKEEQRKNRFETNDKIKKQNQGQNQQIVKSNEQQTKQNKINKLRGIHLYNEDYSRHIENRNFLLLLKQSASENKQKGLFWNELKKEYGQTSCVNDQQWRNDNANHRLAKQFDDNKISMTSSMENENLYAMNINNVMDIVSQIYQNQKLMTLDSMKKLISKVSKMYEQRIRQFERQIICKQQEVKKFSQLCNKRTSNRKDAEVQISEIKLTTHLEKQLEIYKEKLKNSEQIMNNMEELIAKLNNQSMESQKTIFLVKRKLQEREKRCEGLSKKIQLFEKNEKKNFQLSPKKHQKQKQFIDWQSIFNKGKNKQRQNEGQMKDSKGKTQNNLKRMQKTFFQHRNTSFYNNIKSFTKSEKVIRIDQSLSMNISKNKEETNLQRQDTTKKKKKLIKFNFKQKNRSQNQQNKETNVFNQKSTVVEGSNQNDSSQNIENMTSDQIKVQLDFSIKKQNKQKQENFTKRKSDQISINKKWEQNEQKLKGKNYKKQEQRIKDELIDSFQENKTTEEQKLERIDMKSRKKYQSSWILNNHDSLKKDITYNKMKSIQQVIKEQAEKIVKQSQQEDLIKKRDVNKSKKGQRARRTNLNNNTVPIMTYYKEQQQIGQSKNMKNNNKIGEERIQKQSKKSTMERKLKKLSNMHIKRNELNFSPSFKQELKQTGEYYNKSMEVQKKQGKDEKEIRSYASPLKKNIKDNSRAFIENQNKKYLNRKLYQTKVLNFNQNQTQDINDSQ